MWKMLTSVFVCPFLLTQLLIFVNGQCSFNGQCQNGNRLLPFGFSQGDGRLLGDVLTDDTHFIYQLDSALPPIKYLCKEYRNIYIHTNGMVTFETTSTKYEFDKLPLEDDPYTTEPLLGPLMTDIELGTRENHGAVFYNSYSNPDPIFQQARNLLLIPNGLTAYTPEQMVVITWYSVTPYEFDPDSNEKNTFQLVMMQSQSSSYFFFLYGELTWNWGSHLHVIGYQGAVNFAQRVEEHPLSQKLTTSTNIRTWYRRMDLQDEECRFVDPCLANPCQNGGTCQQKYGRYKCVCADGYGGVNCDWDFEDKLVPYGDAQGDERIDRNITDPDDGHFHLKINSTLQPIVFLCKEYRNIYIHSNGFINLQRSFPAQKIFDLPVDPIPNDPLIAPLMSDIDLGRTGNGGSIFYQIYANKDPFLQDVRKWLVKAFSIQNFSPEQMVVITWHRVQPSPFQEVSSEKNTFQLVMLQSKGSSHFCFNYGDLAWSWNVRPHVIGYQGFHGSLSIVETHPQSRLLHSTGGMKQWSRPVHLDPSTCHAVDSPEYKCMEWYRRQDLDLAKELDEKLRPCPCNENQAKERSDIYQPINSQINSNTKRPDSCYVPDYLKDLDRQFTLSNRECCYRENGTLNTDTKWEAGSVLLQNPYRSYSNIGRTSYIQPYTEGDYLPKQWCCKESQLCHIYYRVRKQATCAGYSANLKNIGYMWGDPHIVTLDGFSYEFNGLGEYWLIRSELFSLQGRTEQTTDNKGQPTKATVFTGFAAKDLGEDGGFPVISFLLNEEHDGIDVSIGGHPVQWKLYTSTNQLVLNGMKVFEKSGSVYTKFATGISLTVSFEEDLLNIKVATSDEFMNETTGLLGVINGDKSDDLTTPEGAVLSINSSGQIIFDDFGNRWRILVNESLFVYNEMKTYEDFNDLEFMPFFTEDLDDVLRNLSSAKQQAIVDLCKADHACLYDYVLTGKESIAANTLHTGNKFEEDAALLANSIPLIKAYVWHEGNRQISNIWEVEVGKTSNISVTASDADGDTIVLYAENIPKGAVWSNISGLLRWTPTSIDGVESMIFYAKDSKDAESNTITLVIKICDCSGNGKCNYLVPSSGYQESDSFQVVQCLCDEAWTGPRCDADLDWCTAYEPCYSGQTCTDKTPEEQIRTGLTHECSACPEGTRKEGNKCFDVDECASSQTETCSQKCVNTFGFYECECNIGYRLNQDQRTCSNINECEEQTDECEHVCTDTQGSFSCTCYNGYTSDGYGNCQQVGSTPSGCQTLNCEHDCVVTGRIPKCVCKRGFHLNSDQRTCTDINECSSTNLFTCLNSLCNNTLGSYECECNPGFKVTGNPRICQECVNGWGPGCANSCDCKDFNTVCDAVTGCAACRDGWTDGSCDQDVNECTRNPKICGDHADCVNEEGTYTCNCHEGYEMGQSSPQMCKEIDLCETATETLCLHGGMCVFHGNNITSCDCSTSGGWTGDECQNEKNECSSSPCMNGGICVDKHGYFICQCPDQVSGFQCEKGIDIVTKSTKIRPGSSSAARDIADSIKIACAVCAYIVYKFLW